MTGFIGLYDDGGVVCIASLDSCKRAVPHLIGVLYTFCSSRELVPADLNFSGTDTLNSSQGGSRGWNCNVDTSCNNNNIIALIDSLKERGRGGGGEGEGRGRGGRGEGEGRERGGGGGLGMRKCYRKWVPKIKFIRISTM